MKNWLKANIVSIVGNFFIWVVPFIMALIMAFGGTTIETTTKFKVGLLGIIIAIIYLLVYAKKLKKVLERHKTIQLANIGRVKMWIRIIEWVSYLLPYVIILVLIVALKGCYEKIYDELLLFIIVTMSSATIGYFVLCLDTKMKEGNND